MASLELNGEPFEDEPEDHEIPMIDRVDFIGRWDHGSEPAYGMLVYARLGTLEATHEKYPSLHQYWNVRLQGGME